MNLREAFGIAVRMAGLLSVVYGLYALAGPFWTVFALLFFGRNVHWDTASLISQLAPSCTLVIVGILLMRHAHRVVRFAYPFASGACQNCGYDMRATPGRCPECGTES